MAGGGGRAGGALAALLGAEEGGQALAQGVWGRPLEVEGGGGGVVRGGRAQGEGSLAGRGMVSVVSAVQAQRESQCFRGI